MTEGRTMFWLWIFTSVWLFATGVHSMNSFNAALGKMANQSSVYAQSPGDYTAHKAVDGNTDPNLPNCASTAEDHLPRWWTVDLGKDYTVTSVVVTNRVDHGNRLHDFTVTITSEDNSKDTVCGLYSGAAPPVATLTCNQVTWGRYVKITKPKNHISDILTLCEVQVMAFDRTHMLFEHVTGQPIMTHVTATITTDFPTCAHTCKDSLTCLGINHNRALNQCHLIDSTKCEDISVYTGWDFYVLRP